MEQKEFLESVKEVLEKTKGKDEKPWWTFGAIVLGTLLSLVSSIIFSQISGSHEDSVNLRKIKYAMVEKLVLDAKLRSAMVNDFCNEQDSYNSNKSPSNASLLDSAHHRYVLERLRFEASSAIYESQLKKYFNQSDRNYFVVNIHNPLVYLGEVTEFKNYNHLNPKTWGAARKTLEGRIQEFSDHLYLEIEDK